MEEERMMEGRCDDKRTNNEKKERKEAIDEGKEEIIAWYFLFPFTFLYPIQGHCNM